MRSQQIKSLPRALLFGSPTPSAALFSGSELELLAPLLRQEVVRGLHK